MTILTSSLQNNTLLRTLLMTACAVVALAGMRAISSIFNAFLLAVLIATLCTPIRDWLERRGIRGWAGFLLTFVITLLVGLGAALFIALSIVQVIGELPRYQDKLQALLNDIQAQLSVFGITFSSVADTTTQYSQEIIQVSISVLRSVSGAFSVILLMYLFLFYMLMEGRGVGERLNNALGADDTFVVKTTKFIRDARRYLILRTLVGAGIAVIQTVLMLVMGVDFALLWGFLSFICNYIPNIGFIIGLVPPAVLLFLEQGPVPMIILVVVYSVVNNVVENFVAPRFIGVEVNLSPLSISVSLIFWTFILGPLGAILALPVTLFVKGVLLEADTSGRVLGVLMSADSRDAETPLVPQKDEDAAELS